MTHVPDYVWTVKPGLEELFCTHCHLSPEEHPQDPRVAMVLYDESFAVDQLERVMRAPKKQRPLLLGTRVTYLGNDPPEFTGRTGVIVSLRRDKDLKARVLFDKDIKARVLSAHLFVATSVHAPSRP